MNFCMVLYATHLPPPFLLSLPPPFTLNPPSHPGGVTEGGLGFEGGRGDREGERVNGGSHISSVLIFHDISPHCCLQIICHPPFYALRLLTRLDAVLLSIPLENEM